MRRQHLFLGVVYNIELGPLRRYAVLGGGAYVLRQQRNGEVASASVTKAGWTLGGAEYYLRAVAVRTEMSVHMVGREAEFPELEGKTLSGLTWTVDVKVPL